MSNLDMENLKTPLSWILASIFVVYLGMLITNCNNTENSIIGEKWKITKAWEFNASENKEWNFDSSIAKFLQEISSSALSDRSWNKYAGSDILNNTDFNFGTTSLSNIHFLEVDKEIIEGEVLLEEVEEVEEVIEEDLELVKKKDPAIQKKQPIVKKAKKIAKELPKPVVKEVDEVIKDNKEVIKEESVDVEEKVIINNLISDEGVQHITIKKEESVKSKQITKKPKMRDYKNSSDYQRALRKYYKEIE